ncbi:polysaccharide pyruvyl transferase family protein [Rhodococcus sp. ABRD24]|uniref:polysaccharide pyruvyl transferase family protein n=1 Tax=Rhodococcus sp. ABRD24 TaxID=2507582 RepID=UPI0010394420|nr:polysaccharide pyruvyl transferase family protein [Rhodococcus sp. ABRD24]QBJ95983.1 polysaccharide pyruvyl transferase family protein [Rhodococcus sp. ABRD24]
MSSGSLPDQEIYIWATGQSDNVGDSVLRRVYIDALRPFGIVAVWVGKSGAGYTAGLRLQDCDQLYESFFRWMFGIYRSMLRGKPTLAINAGEFTLTRRYFLWGLFLFPTAALIRLRGGNVLWLGAAIPERRRLLGLPYRLIARVSHILRWREPESSSMLCEAPMMPDWAFASATEDSSIAQVESTVQREFIAVSVRFDRSFPSNNWIEAVQSLAVRHNKSIVLVPQVQRDHIPARRIAEILGAQVIEWRNDNHADQEAIVRSWYRRSDMVISDRLHALIIGMTEGAVPLGWTEVASGKILRHFSGLNMPWVGSSGDKAADQLQGLSPALLADLRQQTIENLDRALSGIRDARSSIGIVLLPGVRNYSDCVETGPEKVSG